MTLPVLSLIQLPVLSNLDKWNFCGLWYQYKTYFENVDKSDNDKSNLDKSSYLRRHAGQILSKGIQITRQQVNLKERWIIWTYDMNTDEQNGAFQKNRMDQKWLHAPLWRSNQPSISWTSRWVVNPDEWICCLLRSICCPLRWNSYPLRWISCQLRWFSCPLGEFIAHSVNSLSTRWIYCPLSELSAH